MDEIDDGVTDQSSSSNWAFFLRSHSLRVPESSKCDRVVTGLEDTDALE